MQDLTASRGSLTVYVFPMSVRVTVTWGTSSEKNKSAKTVWPNVSRLNALENGCELISLAPRCCKIRFAPPPRSVKRTVFAKWFFLVLNFVGLSFPGLVRRNTQNKFQWWQFILKNRRNHCTKTSKVLRRRPTVLTTTSLPDSVLSISDCSVEDLQRVQKFSSGIFDLSDVLVKDISNSWY